MDAVTGDELEALVERCLSEGVPPGVVSRVFELDDAYFERAYLGGHDVEVGGGAHAASRYWPAIESVIVPEIERRPYWPAGILKETGMKPIVVTPETILV